MEEIVMKQLCTGCTCCMEICPKKAIHMEVDENGFKHPVISQEKCINCGACKKACPIINTKNNDSINECYVAFNKSKESLLNKASSGSIFELIANYILDNNGIVIGAAFNSENELRHIAISSKRDLVSLKGSKYLQSDLGNIFEFIKDKVVDRKILFVGTPCQVAGLKSIIKNENLVCVDVVCHGVPSPKLFEKYIKEIEKKYNDKVLNYNFRDKSTGWDNYSNTIDFDNKKITELSKKNNYMKLFLSDIALRDSCYNCNFKLGNKYSDITLGDFWGVNNFFPEMYNKNGVSAIIVNTKSGQKMFEEIKNEIVFKKCFLSDIVKGNPSLKISCSKNRNRENFFRDIDMLSIEQLVKKYVKRENILKKILRKIKKIFFK